MYVCTCMYIDMLLCMHCMFYGYIRIYRGVGAEALDAYAKRVHGSMYRKIDVSFSPISCRSLCLNISFSFSCPSLAPCVLLSLARSLSRSVCRSVGRARGQLPRHFTSASSASTPHLCLICLGLQLYFTASQYCMLLYL